VAIGHERSHDQDSSGVYGGGDMIFNQINYAELQKLRGVIRKDWDKHFGTTRPYSDYEADKMIAAIAPDTREKLIAQKVSALF